MCERERERVACHTVLIVVCTSPKTVWAHYAISRRECGTQSRDCLIMLRNLKIEWNIYFYEN